MFSIKSKYFNILTYHEILTHTDSLFPEYFTCAKFEKHIQIIAKYFHSFTISQALWLLQQKQLPFPSVCVSFDDGYANNCENSLPILQKYQVPATFFITTGYINGGMMWNDKVVEAIRHSKLEQLNLQDIALSTYPIKTITEKRNTIDQLLSLLKYLDFNERADKVAYIQQQTQVDLNSDNNLMLNAKQIKQLADAEMEIAGHTVYHPILAKISPEQVRQEITQNKQDLEQIIQQEIHGFAYPNGKLNQDYSLRDVSIVKEIGFDYAASTAFGSITCSTDHYQLKRTSAWGNNIIKLLWQLGRKY